MDDAIFSQLCELARAFDRIGIRPIVCGGLGIYLCFADRDAEQRTMIRATSDIDLMLTRAQLIDVSLASAVAEIITGELDYIVRDDAMHFRFTRRDNQQLDILSAPMDGFVTEGGRVKFVRGVLHGRLTEEAQFIDEDLRTVELSAVSDSAEAGGLAVQVPSPTNLMILKLFAFRDRMSAGRLNAERAQTHAYDVYVTVALSTRDDYLEGQSILYRHGDSDIVRRVIEIVGSNFSSVEQPGLGNVLQTAAFYPNLGISDRRSRLEVAAARIARWFSPKR